jgi:FKBP-type peptidyl-prolyl cis-trans isomerase
MQGKQLEGYTPVANVNQLQVNDLTEGEGAEAKADSTVTAHYTGALAKTGVIFESSKDRGEPATFPLAQVIKGWQEGVPGMKEGGKRRLIIPAELAYGEQGSPPAIGPNEPLVFDIELVSVK